jgi:hypothetical protein
MHAEGVHAGSYSKFHIDYRGKVCALYLMNGRGIFRHRYYAAVIREETQGVQADESYLDAAISIPTRTNCRREHQARRTKQRRIKLTRNLGRSRSRWPWRAWNGSADQAAMSHYTYRSAYTETRKTASSADAVSETRQDEDPHLRTIDLTWRRFGRLIVYEKANIRGRAKCCRCSCGIAKVSRNTSPEKWATKSCGCLRTDRVRKFSTHGQSGKDGKQNLYLLKNCFNVVPAQGSFKWKVMAGAESIADVAQVRYFADMGGRPRGMTSTGNNKKHHKGAADGRRHCSNAITSAAQDTDMTEKMKTVYLWVVVW